MPRSKRKPGERKRDGKQKKPPPAGAADTTKHRREREIETETALKAEGTEIRNQISVNLKESKAKQKKSGGFLTCCMQGKYSQPETFSNQTGGSISCTYYR